MHFLSRLGGVRDYGAWEDGWKAFLKPLFGEQLQVAPGHVDDAGCIFNLGQGSVVVRLSVMTGGEGNAGRAAAISE
jgi:hypothetical protein